MHICIQWVPTIGFLTFFGMNLFIVSIKILVYCVQCVRGRYYVSEVQMPPSRIWRVLNLVPQCTLTCEPFSYEFKFCLFLLVIPSSRNSGALSNVSVPYWTPSACGTTVTTASAAACSAAAAAAVSFSVGSISVQCPYKVMYSSSRHWMITLWQGAWPLWKQTWY